MKTVSPTVASQLCIASLLLTFADGRTLYIYTKLGATKMLLNAYWPAGSTYTDIETLDSTCHNYLPSWTIEKPFSTPSLPVRAQLVQVTAEGRPTRVTYQRTLKTAQSETFLFNFSGQLQASNTGSYRLAVVTPEPSFSLNVVVPPKVTSLVVKKATIGQATVSHQCCASGNPPPSVTWSVNGTVCSDCTEMPPVTSVVTSGLWSVCKNLTIPRRHLTKESLFNVSCTARANFSSSKCSPPPAPQTKCQESANSAETKFSLMHVSRPAESVSDHGPNSLQPDTSQPSSTVLPTTARPSTATTESSQSEITTELRIKAPTEDTSSPKAAGTSPHKPGQQTTPSNTTITALLPTLMATVTNFLLGLAVGHFVLRFKNVGDNSSTTIGEVMRSVARKDNGRVYAEPDYVTMHKPVAPPTAMKLTSNAAYVKGPVTGIKTTVEGQDLPPSDPVKIKDLPDYTVLV